MSRIFPQCSNCFMEPKCVKCDKSHEIGKCDIPKDGIKERENIFCVLCNKYGHPASYKGCEKYKELQRRIKARRLDMSQKQPQNAMNINTNLSYAKKVMKITFI